MKNPWPVVALGDLCDIALGATPTRNVSRYWDPEKRTDNVWLSIADMPTSLHAQVADSKEYLSREGAATKGRLVKKGTLLVSFKLTLGRLAYAGRDLYTNEAIAALTIREPKRLMNQYLYWYLTYFDWDEAAKHDEKLKGKTLNKAKLKVLPVLLPPLAEQKRIVAILDEAFAAIDAATNNIQNNLNNASDVHASQLDGVLFGEKHNWPRHRLGSIVHRLTNGYVGPIKDVYVEAGVPYLLARHVRDNTLRFDRKTFISHDFNQKAKKSILKSGDVLLVQSGHIGHSAVVPAEHDGHNCHAMIVITPIEKHLSGEFLSLFFQSRGMRKTFNEIRSGSTVPHLTCKLVRELEIPVPDRNAQRYIVAESQALFDAGDQLAGLYTRKLALLVELKQSILHKAFTGELTADKSIPASIPFPLAINGISTTDLHAGILAIAYRLHESAGTLKYFGHVKGEKMAHMVEAHVGLDLGRKPVKDAAGPDDYRHLKAVEHRAQKANFFLTKRRGDRYELSPLGGFDRLIARVNAALGDRLADVERMIATMLKWDSETSEILATVFATWNNLLLDGNKPTDEQIVYEAREKWHEDKLKIDRARFFKAIKWMRDNGVVPVGRGKRVSEKVG